MHSLLVGINAKYIHPAVAIYQLKKNTTYPCDILEFTIKEKTEDIYASIYSHLSGQKISLIGFSCYLWNIEKILFLICLVKKDFPNVVIMCGGPEVGFDAKYYLENNPSIDYIIYGEGEDAFHELCLYLDKKLPLDQVSNLCYLMDGKYFQNELKNPDLSKIQLATLDIHDLTNRVVYLESGRGCPYNCSYCTASLDNKVRFFPLKNVMSIVDQLMALKVKTVKFLDRTFNANMKYMIAILDYIDTHNICTSFQFEIVAEKFTKEAIDKVASLQNKFLRFEIGIQSIHDDVNEAVCRHQNMQLLEKNLLLLNQTNKVDLHVDLIAGLPYETLDRFITSFNRVFYYQAKELQLGFLKFLRGTKLMDTIDEHEYIYDPLPPYEIIQNKYMSKDDLEEIHLVEKMLEIYYNKGKFKHTFHYLLTNRLIENPYMFFLHLNEHFDAKNLMDQYIYIKDYFQKHFSSNATILTFYLMMDYLESHKTKPKIWWPSFVNKENRKSIYEKICKKSTLSLDDLYRYSIIVMNADLQKIYVILYKNFKPIHLLLDL